MKGGRGRVSAERDCGRGKIRLSDELRPAQTRNAADTPNAAGGWRRRRRRRRRFLGHRKLAARGFSPRPIRVLLQPPRLAASSSLLAPRVFLPPSPTTTVTTPTSSSSPSPLNPPPPPPRAGCGVYKFSLTSSSRLVCEKNSAAP